MIVTDSRTPLELNGKAAAVATEPFAFPKNVIRYSLSPGERAGVRASVTTIF
jgi:hypothetical protein